MSGQSQSLLPFRLAPEADTAALKHEGTVLVLSVSLFCSACFCRRLAPTKSFPSA